MGNGGAKSSERRLTELEGGRAEDSSRLRDLEIAMARVESSLGTLKNIGTALIIGVVVLIVETAFKFGL